MSRAWFDPLDSSLRIDRADRAVRFAGAGKMVRGLPLNKALVVIGVLLVTVLAALFAIPALVDWSRYRGGFEEQASRLLGRSVRVGEHVRLALLPTPYISFDNVRVADASGRFDTPLLRMESFRLQLAVAPLLTGSLVAQDVELMAPALRLAVGPDGRGNWMGLGRSAAGSAAGDLRGLALNAVHIDRGTVELIDASGKQTLRLEGITGDLEAPTLQGPYSFKGGLAQAGKPSELKFWAGRQGAAGEISLKSQWRIGGDRGRSYTFDGNLKGLEAVPTVTGALDGRIGFVPDAQPGAVGRPGVASLDFKAKVLATMDSATLGDLDVTFDGGARPQHATGTAVLGWRDGLPTEADLTAVALDFDQIAGMTARPAPLRTIQALVGELGGALGNDTDAHVRLSVQDATLGGASIGDLKLAARYSGLGLAIESLSAKLPGQSRLDASGDLTAGASARFEGKVRLWGANIAALSNWAAPELRLANAGGVSSFLVDSAVIADSEHFQANSMRMEISGTTVTGSVRYGATEPRSLSLTLDSGRLDLTRLFETPLSLAALEGASPQPGDGAAEPGNDVWHALRSMFSGDTHLDLRIGHLITAQGSLRDVSAKLDRSNGRLNIPAIDLATDDGFALHVEGALQAKDAEGQGQLRLHVAAPDDKAIASAVRFAGVGDGLAGLQKPLAAMTPLSLAGTIVVGMNSATSQELALDGMANGSHLTVSEVLTVLGSTDALESTEQVTASVVSKCAV